MASAGKKILIVDDEPAICGLVEAYLKKKGYEIATANNGNDALSIVKTGSVDLVARTTDGRYWLADYKTNLISDGD